MAFDIESMKRELTGLTEAELLKIVTLEREEYRLETVDFATGELKRRGFGEITEQHLEEQRAAVEEDERESLTGLGGWLILVGFNLVFFTFSYGWELLEVSATIAFEGIQFWLNGSSDHPLWMPSLVFEITAMSVLTLAGIALIWLYFRRSWRFPQLYVALITADLLHRLVFIALVGIIQRSGAAFDEGTVLGIFRSVVFILIWGAYMKSSKRVGNTFVRGAPVTPAPPPVPCPTAAARSGP